MSEVKVFKSRATADQSPLVDSTFQLRFSLFLPTLSSLLYSTRQLPVTTEYSLLTLETMFT